MEESVRKIQQIFKMITVREKLKEDIKNNE